MGTEAGGAAEEREKTYPVEPNNVIPMNPLRSLRQKVISSATFDQ